jgi:pSer/pThr/pTyr-binding forkhead associated (FHA) protein
MMTCINESEVSRKHAIIAKVNNTEFIIEDLDSASGTFVNGKRIKKNLSD